MDSPADPATLPSMRLPSPTTHASSPSGVPRVVQSLDRGAGVDGLRTRAGRHIWRSPRAASGPEGAGGLEVGWAATSGDRCDVVGVGGEVVAVDGVVELDAEDVGARGEGLAWFEGDVVHQAGRDLVHGCGEVCGG